MVTSGSTRTSHLSIPVLSTKTQSVTFLSKRVRQSLVWSPSAPKGIRKPQASAAHASLSSSSIVKERTTSAVLGPKNFPQPFSRSPARLSDWINKSERFSRQRRRRPRCEAYIVVASVRCQRPFSIILKFLRQRSRDTLETGRRPHWSPISFLPHP